MSFPAVADIFKCAILLLLLLLLLFAEALILFCRESAENFNDREIPGEDGRFADFRELTSQ